MGTSSGWLVVKGDVMLPNRRRQFPGLFGLVLVVALVAVSCGTDAGVGELSASEDTSTVDQASTEAPEGVWGPLAVVSSGDGSDAALIAGTIRVSNGCVLLDEQGSDVLLVWPADRTSWDPVNEVVSIESLEGTTVELRDGDSVTFGGGGSSAAEGGQSAGEFLASVSWISEPELSCVTETRWFIGEVVDEAVLGSTQSTTPAGPGELVVPECNDEAMCPEAFIIDGLFYSVGCTAIRDSAVSDYVIGSGDLHGEPATVHRITGVDETVMVALSFPSGSCSENDPNERHTSWSMAFADGADQADISAAVCDVGELSPAQRLADGCHLNDELLTCGAGPGFPPDVLSDLTLYPEPTDSFGADIAAILGTDDPQELVGWHVIVEEQQNDGSYIQLLLRQDPETDQLQYLLDGSVNIFDAPRQCEPKALN